MIIKEYSLINKEWIEETKKYYIENRNKYDIKTRPTYWKYWDNKIQTIKEIEKQLISPIPICNNIWDESHKCWVEKSRMYSDSKLHFTQAKEDYINSDIKIDITSL